MCCRILHSAGWAVLLCVGGKFLGRNIGVERLGTGGVAAAGGGFCILHSMQLSAASVAAPSRLCPEVWQLVSAAQTSADTFPLVVYTHTSFHTAIPSAMYSKVEVKMPAQNGRNLC